MGRGRVVDGIGNSDLRHERLKDKKVSRGPEGNR